MKLVLALVLLLATSITHAADVKLAWTFDSATCADGSPIANCPTAGFEISEASVLAGPYAIKENVGPGARSQTWTGIAAGTTKCFSMKTLVGTSPNYLKSDESTRACITVPFIPPKAPQGITVTVQVTVSTP